MEHGILSELSPLLDDEDDFSILFNSNASIRQRNRCRKSPRPRQHRPRSEGDRPPLVLRITLGLLGLWFPHSSSTAASTSTSSQTLSTEEDLASTSVLDSLMMSSGDEQCYRVSSDDEIDNDCPERSGDHLMKQNKLRRGKAMDRKGTCNTPGESENRYVGYDFSCFIMTVKLFPYTAIIEPPKLISHYYQTWATFRSDFFSTAWRSIEAFCQCTPSLALPLYNT